MQPSSENKSRGSLLSEFAAYYKPHWGIFCLDLFCALLIALVDVLFPVVTRRMLYQYIPQGASRLLAAANLLRGDAFVRRFTADREIPAGSFVQVRLTGTMDGELTGEAV